MNRGCRVKRTIGSVRQLYSHCTFKHTSNRKYGELQTPRWHIVGKYASLSPSMNTRLMVAFLCFPMAVHPVAISGFHRVLADALRKLWKAEPISRHKTEGLTVTVTTLFNIITEETQSLNRNKQKRCKRGKPNKTSVCANRITGK
jgi:hypothetical protein